jgi:simple sugar transport system permease protein
VAERTGVINLGVEGMMLIGAVAGFAAAAHPVVAPWPGCRPAPWPACWRR